MEALTVSKVLGWLDGKEESKTTRSIRDELMLIEQYEKMKHNHFSKENIREAFNDTPDSIKPVLVQRIFQFADSRNVTLVNATSDKFFEMYAEYTKTAIKYAQEELLDEEELFGDDWLCGHDVEMNRKIQSSLDYIEVLINKH